MTCLIKRQAIRDSVGFRPKPFENLFLHGNLETTCEIDEKSASAILNHFYKTDPGSVITDISLYEGFRLVND